MSAEIIANNDNNERKKNVEEKVQYFNKNLFIFINQ